MLARRLRLAELVRDLQLPARRRARVVDRDARVDGDERQLAVARLEHAEVGDDDAHPLAEARREVEPLDERARVLAQHHEDVADAVAISGAPPPPGSRTFGAS